MKTSILGGLIMNFAFLLTLHCIVIYTFSGVYAYIKDRKSELNNVYMLLCASHSIWAAASLVKTQALDLQIISRWSIIEYGALCGIAALVMHFAVIITKGGSIIRKVRYIFIYSPSIILFVYRWIFYGRRNYLRVTFHSFFSECFFLYHVSYTMAALILVWLWGIKSQSMRVKKQAAIIVLTGCIAFILSSVNQIAAFFFRDYNIPQIPYVFFLIATMGILYAMIKYKFMCPSALITAEDILQNVRDLIILADTEGKIIRINERVEKLLGYEREELLGRHLKKLFAEEDCELAAGLESDSSEKIYYIDKYLKTKEGITIPVDIHLSSIRDSCGDTAGMVLVGRDKRILRQLQQEIAERKQAEEQLLYLSMHDSLTGLYNRTYFERELTEISLGIHNSVAIIICDVDGLKFINDTLGHKYGDELLTAAASVLMGFQSKDQIVCRIGGDEFAMLIKEDKTEKTKQIAEELQQSIARHNIDNPHLPVSISIGYAVWDYSTKDIVDLFKEADGNMYRMKLSQRHSTRNAIAGTLAKTLEARDFISEGHVDRLQELVSKLALAVGFSQQEIIDIKVFAQFHDIGKVGISDRILFKEGRLTKEEATEIRRHSEIGYRIAHSSPELIHIADWILMHHEWWNGEGYPMGIRGADIPIQCRILAICDAYDAMTNDRPYREAMSREKALEELLNCSGTQFEPKLVDIFIKLMENKQESTEEKVVS
jgi:diguanylate cyclase (GGDEF)-like protein/PAS domain S-box-containing protein